MANGPSTFTTSNVILSSAASLASFAINAAKAYTDSFFTSVAPSLPVKMVCSTAWSAKLETSIAESAVFIAWKSRLTAALTESSTDWAWIVVQDRQKKISVKYFI